MECREVDRSGIPEPFHGPQSVIIRGASRAYFTPASGGGPRWNAAPA
jgi:hypothetical protein